MQRIVETRRLVCVGRVKNGAKKALLNFSRFLTDMNNDLHVMNSDSGTTLCGWLFRSLSVCVCVASVGAGLTGPQTSKIVPNGQRPQKNRPDHHNPYNSLLYTKSLKECLAQQRSLQACWSRERSCTSSGQSLLRTCAKSGTSLTMPRTVLLDLFPAARSPT